MRFGNGDIGAFEYQFKVTSTADSGPGSLRQVITDANASPGPDTVVFKIPGVGVHTIQPSYVVGGISLPVIADAVTIDGWSQGGAGYTGPPLIEIDGTKPATPASAPSG